MGGATVQAPDPPRPQRVPDTVQAPHRVVPIWCVAPS